MIEFFYGLALSIVSFAFIMTAIVIMGRTIGRWFGPEEK
jgi:hypothetical protein